MRSAKIENILRQDIIAADITPAQRAHRLHMLALTLTEEEWRALEGILKNKTFAARLLRAYVDAQEENVCQTSFYFAYPRCDVFQPLPFFFTPIDVLGFTQRSMAQVCR